MEKYLASKTDVMITINETDRSTAQKYLDISIVEKCHGMGVNLSRFRDAAPSDEERIAQRKALGIAPDDFVLSYVAEIIDNKNQITLDAQSIAQYLMTVEYKPYPPSFYHMDQLKSLTRFRDSLVQQHSRQLVELTNILDKVFVNSGRTATLARRFSHGVTGF